MLGTTIINPSGLDASAVGSPSLVKGVSGRAVELDTPTQYVKVSGPGHRYECFGDLDLCNLGKNLSCNKTENFQKCSDLKSFSENNFFFNKNIYEMFKLLILTNCVTYVFK